MSLFPLLHYGESIIDFETSAFFHRQAVFHSVRELQGAEVAVLVVGKFFEEPLKNVKSVENSKINLEFCEKFSKVSVDSFMAV